MYLKHSSTQVLDFSSCRWLFGVFLMFLHVKILKKASVKKEWTEDLLIIYWDRCVSRGSTCWLMAPVRHLDFILDPHPPVRHCYELVYYSSCRMIKVLLPMLRLSSSFSMYKETLMSHNALWPTAGILKPHTSFWEAMIMKQFVILKDLSSEMWLYCLQGIW